MLGFESILTGGLTVVVYTLILVSIYRVFQIGTDVGEIKELLKEIKRNTAAADSQRAAATGGSHAPESAEALVRAVHAASYQEIVDSVETTDNKPA